MFIKFCVCREIVAWSIYWLLLAFHLFSLSGTHFSYGFSFVIQIRWTFGFNVTYCCKSLHMTRQHSCRAMCKISHRSLHCNLDNRRIHFPRISITNRLRVTYSPACRTTLVATRFRVAVICPIIQVPHCIRVFFYFVWFVFINHIFQFYYELCTYCNILDIYLS